MQSHDLAVKLFAEQQRSVKFIEQYYSDRIGSPIKIELTRYSKTSHWEPDTDRIYIATYNLQEFFDYNEQLARPLFYSLLLHEIGHAIYTGQLPYSDLNNILEDNRLEYQISKWNTRVQFKLMRYIYQDKKIKELVKYNPDRLYQDKLAMALALMRTTQTKLYADMIGYTKARKDIVKDILKYNDKYMRLDYELRKVHSQTDQKYQELKNISLIIDSLLQELLDTHDKQEQEQQQQQKQQEQQQQGSSDNEQEQEQQQEQQQQRAHGSSGDEDEQIQEQLSRLIQQAKKMQEDAYYDTPILYNDTLDTSDYNKHHISVFDTARHSGIRGKSNMHSSVGNAKQLSMQRYMRRGFVKNEKLFDKTHETTRGGKSAKVCFYLDISGSMQGDRIQIASDYLKSFYDTMHKHCEIRIFGFGRNTYKMTRNELNNNFLEQRLQGATRLREQKHPKNEKIIVITDGIIDNTLSDYMNRNAQFVIIDAEKSSEPYYKDYVNKTYVMTKNIKQGLDNATKSIRHMLMG